MSKIYNIPDRKCDPSQCGYLSFPFHLKLFRVFCVILLAHEGNVKSTWSLLLMDLAV